MRRSNAVGRITIISSLSLFTCRPPVVGANAYTVADSMALIIRGRVHRATGVRALIVGS